MAGLTRVLAHELPRWPAVEEAYWTDGPVKMQLDLLSEYLDLTREVLTRQAPIMPADMVEHLMWLMAVRVLMAVNARAEDAAVRRELLSRTQWPFGGLS
jgi:hypothetical protein